MDALIQWATQIVIFLLLAMVIDLLIPANGMKKYIRLVVGLILILIFLKPIFFLFEINIQQALEASFQQLNQDETNSETLENSIEMQKNEIQASQTAYILEEMAVQLKDLAKTPVLEGFQAEILDIQISSEKELTYEGLEGVEGLDGVIVYLRENENGEGEVNIVDNVEINTESPVINESEEDDQEIKTLLQDVWDIDDNKISIVWEGGAP